MGFDEEPTLVVKTPEKPKIDFVVEPAPPQLVDQDERGPSIFPRRPVDEDFSKPPPNCMVWFDGCNKCRVMGDDKLACTRMACRERKESKCLKWKEPKAHRPCKVWFDGCNRCTRGVCTEMACSKYQEPKCLEFEELEG